MPADSTAKINQAVDDCLEKCAGTAAPFSLLSDYLKEGRVILAAALGKNGLFDKIAVHVAPRRPQ
jgi:hypothetical protein